MLETKKLLNVSSIEQQGFPKKVMISFICGLEPLFCFMLIYFQVIQVHLLRLIELGMVSFFRKLGCRQYFGSIDKLAA